MSTMHQQQVIMWLGVEIAEKRARIADLENELVNTHEALEVALAKLRQLDETENLGEDEAGEREDEE